MLRREKARVLERRQHNNLSIDRSRAKMQFVAILLVLFVAGINAGSKSKPHGHQGVLEPYDGKPLPLKLTADQEKKLEKGEAVLKLYKFHSGRFLLSVLLQLGFVQ